MRYRKRFFLVIISVILGFLVTNTVARADDSLSLWATGVQPTVSVGPDLLDMPPYYMGDCEYSMEPLVSAQTIATQLKNLCVVAGKDVDIGYVRNGSSPWAVRFKSDQAFRLLKVNATVVQFVRSTNTLVTASTGGVAYADLTTQLIPTQRNPQTNEVTEYGVTMKGVDLSVPTQDPSHPLFFDVMINNQLGLVTGDGPYALINLKDVGFSKINLTTGTPVLIASYTEGIDDYGFNSLLDPYIGAISNDGRYVFVGGSKFMIYDTANCGDPLAAAASGYGFFKFFGQHIGPGKYHMLSPCPHVDITDAVSAKYPGGIIAPLRGKFSNDDSELSFVASQDMQHFTQITINASGSPPSDTSKLEYLALGDSYSSGEGDIDKDGTANNYINNTAARGGCHVSGRSYPFLLKRYYAINNEKMKSIACSGARVTFDYNRSLDGYRGQGNRLSWLDDDTWLKNEQQYALDNFIPGEVPQLEFVKKYKPKIVTLMGGGNDVGFANILAYCASPEKVGFILIPYTCDYAKKGSELESMLYSSIDSQYANNTSLVRAIKSVSPNSRIIIVSYPSFITDRTAVCGLNGGDLDSDERAMIQNSVRYMNTMLAQVAHDTNVSYVDVQNSLNGGRICEGSEYITGLYKVGIFGDHDGAFHPNALGQEKMAESIEKSGAMTREIVPSAQNFSTSSNIISRSVEMITNGVIVGSQGILLSIEAHVFASNTDVTATMYSDRIPLGTFATSADGSIDHTVNSRGLPLGRHVLVLSGKSPSGDSVELYQFIEIKYSQIDGDGDGIPDAQDTCNYIVSWYDEQAGKDTCVLSTKTNDVDTKKFLSKSTDTGVNNKDSTNETYPASIEHKSSQSGSLKRVGSHERAAHDRKITIIGTIARYYGVYLAIVTTCGIIIFGVRHAIKNRQR